MATFEPTTITAISETCKSGAAQAVVTMSQILEAEIDLTPSEPESMDAESLIASIAGPGLVVAFRFADTGAALLIPESTGVLPPWYKDTDSASKLATLAQELGPCLFPESLTPLESVSFSPPDLASGLRKSGLAPNVTMLRLGDAMLVFSIDKINAFDTTATKPAKRKMLIEPELGPSGLPKHTESLLKIRLPVVVKLANKKQSVDDILELSPGAIIQFDKSCEETLDLEVGDHQVAVGEAVKVGDKFGLRITSMIMPDERFQTLRVPD